MKNRGYFLLICMTMLSMQASSNTASRFVLSSADKELATNVPLVYTANAFGCTGGNTSPELHHTLPLNLAASSEPFVALPAL